MAEWRISLADTLKFNPCATPFKGNKYFSEAEQALILPNGWDDEVVAYYIAERSEQDLLWWCGLRWADGSRVIPLTGKQAWAAIKAAREAKKAAEPPKP